MDITINTDQMAEVGDNLKAIIQDGMLILVIDPKKDLGLSTSGKMRGVGSSGGFVPVPGGLRANIYIGKKV